MLTDWYLPVSYLDSYISEHSLHNYKLTVLTMQHWGLPGWLHWLMYISHCMVSQVQPLGLPDGSCRLKFWLSSIGKPRLVLVFMYGTHFPTDCQMHCQFLPSESLLSPCWSSWSWLACTKQPKLMVTSSRSHVAGPRAPQLLLRRFHIVKSPEFGASVDLYTYM